MFSTHIEHELFGMVPNDLGESSRLVKALYWATLIAPGVHPEQVNGPLWSLVYEMRVSLLFPLVIIL